MMTNSFNVSAGIAILSLMCYGAVSVHGVETAVNLGTAEDFAILAKWGVFTTGACFITGDVGTYSEVSWEFDISSLVEGNLYSSDPDYYSSIPTKMKTAIIDMEMAFNDEN